LSFSLNAIQGRDFRNCFVYWTDETFKKGDFSKGGGEQYVPRNILCTVIYYREFG